MGQNKSIRETKGFKRLTKAIISIFLASTVLNNVSPFNNGNTVHAEAPAGSVVYTEVEPISWTRTHDIRNEGSYNVQEARPKTNGDLVNFNKYFTSTGGNNYILDKKPVGAPAEGVILMGDLFSNQYTFDYDMLETLLNPTDTNVWDGKGSNPYSGFPAPGQISRVQKVKNYYGGTIPSTFPDFASWQYSPYNDASNPWKYGDQLRLFKGTFDLTADDLANYDFFIGVGDNKELVLPIDDTMMVLVDEQPVGINYTTASNSVGKSIKIRNNTKGVTYDIPFQLTEDIYGWIPGNQKSCSIEAHKGLSAHTDGLHVHLDKVQTNGKILGDITDAIKANTGTSHKIEILASDYNVSGGMAKLDIVKVKKPNTSTVKEAYVNGTLVSSSATPSTIGSAKAGETINYKFQYTNLDVTPVYDMEFTDATLNISITKDAATFNGSALTDLVVTLTKADTTTLVGGKEILGTALNNGDSITVESPSLAHQVTSAEGVAGTNISNKVSVIGKYYKDVPTLPTEATVEVTPISLASSVVTSKEAFADPNYIYPVTTTLTGEKVYYQFKIENTGEVDLNNVKFTDNDFNGKNDRVEISQDGIKINGLTPATNNLIVKKYKAGIEIDAGVSKLDKLLNLKIGETIVVTDSVNVYRGITATSGTISNTVEGKGTYDLAGTPTDVKDEATATVNVNNPQVTTSKIAFTNITTQAQANVAYANEKIYYKFILENTGTQDLKEVSFNDLNFNGTDSFVLNSGGITINGITPPLDNLIVKKYKNNVEIDKASINLDKLKTLNIGEKIEITDTINLYRRVKTTDLKGSILNNTVIGNGTYTYGGVDKTVSDNATANVTVNEQVIEVVNEAYLGNTLVASSEPITELPVVTGSDLDYKITLTNKGPELITDVVINDTTLKVVISKDGVTKDGAVTVALNLVITKYDALGNVIATGGEDDLSTILSQLNPDEYIVVSDPNLLTAVQTSEGLLVNIAEGTGKYANDLEIKDTATVDTDGKVASIVTDKKSLVSGAQTTKAYPGQTVEYKLSAINTGTIVLENIIFNDPKLDIRISKDGEYKISTSSFLPATLKVVVYTDNTETVEVANETGIAALNLLNTLEPGQMVVVSDPVILIKNIVADSEDANNTVTASAYTWDGTERKDDDSVTVSVRQPLMNIIKEVYDDETNVLISSSDKSVTTSKEAYVGKKVNYQFVITNDGATELKDLVVVDSQLGINLTSISYSKSETNLVIKKYNASNTEIETGVADQKLKLANLDIGGYIVVSDTDDLSKILTTTDEINSPIINTVLLNAKDPSFTAIEERNATVDFKVKHEGIDVQEDAFIDSSTEDSITKAYEGQTVFFKYTLENTGTADLTDLTFTSDNFDGARDIEISNGVVKIDGVVPTTNNLTVTKYDVNGTEIEATLTAAEKLASLKPGEYVVVTDTDNLYKNVTVFDEGTNITNTVVGSGDYGYTGFKETITDDDSIAIPVNNQVIEVINEAYLKGTLVASSEPMTEMAVVTGSDLDYKITLTNKGPEVIKDVVINDTTLGIIISKDGVTKDGVATVAPNLVITKYDASGNEIIAGGESDLNAILSQLNPDEYIVVSDPNLLTAVQTNEGQLANIAEGTAKYENDLEVKDTATVDTEGKVATVVTDKTAYVNGTQVTETYPGQKVEYKLSLTNTGDLAMKNVSFTDSTLNIKISKDGEYRTPANTLLPATLIVIVYTDNTESTIFANATGLAALDLLKTLEPGQKVVVSDSINLIKNIDETSTDANNTVIGSAYTWDGTEKTSTDIVIVSVEKPSMNIIKEVYDEASNILISTSDVSVLNTPKEAYVGKKVNFSFKITNDGETALKDLTIEDSILGVNLTKSTYSNVETKLVVKKYNASGAEIEKLVVDQKSKLSNLEIGEYIVVSDTDNLSKVLTKTDAANSPISNTVTLNAKDPSDAAIAETNATVDFNVKDAVVEAKEEAFIDVNTEEPITAAYAGQKVFYKFILENTGTTDLSNIILTSDKFDGVNNVEIANGVVKINNVVPTTSNLVVKKYDLTGTEIEVNLTAAEKFASLKVGEKIVATDTDNLYKNITTADEGTDITNIVIGSGEYGYPGFEDAAEDDAPVVIPTKEQEIAVIKEALVDNVVVASSDNLTKLNVFTNQKVDYRLSITNNGPNTINDIVIYDTTLGVKITKDGIELNGTKVNSIALVINKITTAGVQSGSEADLLSMFSELKDGETIIVNDSLFLSNIPTIEGPLNNTVIGSGKYQNDLPISKEETVSVPVIENNDVDIVKTIGKVTRDSVVIYDSSVNQLSELPERFYPEDKVDFNYVINNTGASTVKNLYLSDVLTNQGITDVTDWIFTKDGVVFNHEDFSITAGETINLVTTWTVENTCKKLALNSVDLLRKNPVTSNFDTLDQSSVNFMVYPKIFVTIDCKDDLEKQFYVTVTGTDGFKTGMYLKHGEKVELDNLNFDVDYTVTETIPMNYDLTGIDIGNGTNLDGNKTVINNLEFSLMTAGHPETITVKNEKEDSKQFRDDAEVTNTLEYTK